jgi:transposase
MGRVVIGMDPHKRSATIEVLDEAEQPLMAGRFGTDSAGYRLLLAAGRQFGQRLWAVEGCQGVGRHLAQRLVADGEHVVDVPAKLSARTRVFSTGQGRKTDATDAHSIAVVALRTRSLRRVRCDDRTVALRLLADRRDELGAARTVTINRLHRLLVELVPGGAKKALTARQARALLADAPAGDVVRETRRQLAAELVDELEVIDARITTAKKQLATLVAETGSGLMHLNGIGPSGAARLLGDIGDIGDVSRFPTKAHFASWNGTAPLDASSGDQTRHRLSRAGNRRINRALHIMAVVQLRHPRTDGRRYYDRRVAEGKTPMEAMRALKRRLSDVVYRRLVNDQKQQQARNRDQDPETRRTGSEGHMGATTKSSAAGSNPNAGASDKSLSEPASIDATPTPDASPARTPGRSRRR